jgi:hypothetical protein
MLSLELSGAVTAGLRGRHGSSGVVKQSGPGVPVEVLGTFHLIGPVSANASQEVKHQAAQHASRSKPRVFFCLNSQFDLEALWLLAQVLRFSIGRCLLSIPFSMALKAKHTQVVLLGITGSQQMTSGLCAGLKPCLPDHMMIRLVSLIIAGGE